ncbi:MULTISPECIES: hypothetical protein [unclassified Paenibacillus]|uniref:hypothetical protein n=1 Tax=unclassified Paenibacillus TaxID=185978 RepID=UPI001AE4574A|nr:MULTISPECIES: hypothetical protein [unclassified Paenibacillus]MBP1154009.1 hypothetical protein [Paenibacillus sp. PvP091]MBP1170606.1 hypothetical protein [Paenibacillus sp. PvR098]MBP2441634.1 hypothetical protein [Paenibacillus sp. PvP052]
MNSLLTKIVQYEAFQKVHTDLSAVSEETINNIMTSFKRALQENRSAIAGSKNKDQLRIALMQEQLIVQAQASQYLSITDEFTERHKNLWKFNSKAPEIFFETAYDQLASYFQSKKNLMHRKLEADSSWYSGIKDSAKKMGSLVNMAVKGANQLSEKLGGQKLTANENVVDDKSIVEALMETYLHPNDVSLDIGRMLGQCNKVYEEAWKKELTAQQPDLERIIPHMLVHKARGNVDLQFNVGATEQILMVSIGTTVASVLALAAGWHTLTWAILNVFPPMAIFVAALTMVTGFLTKESALKQRKKQIDDSVNQYYHYFLTYLDVIKLKELGNRSLREHIVEAGESIIGKTVAQWETALLGGLTIDHYRQLNAAFSRHLLYTQEALDQLAELEQK